MYFGPMLATKMVPCWSILVVEMTSKKQTIFKTCLGSALGGVLGVPWSPDLKALAHVVHKGSVAARGGSRV